MNPSIRQTLLEELENVLSGIRKNNGFHSDIGTALVLAEGKRDLEELPALWLTPGMEECETTRYGEDSLTLPLTIRAGLRYTLHDAPDLQERAMARAAENVLADIRQALGQFEEENETADSVRYVSGGVEDWPDWSQGEVSLFVSVQAEIQYSTARNNPYG